MLLQLAPAPSTKRRRAGMLVTKVPINSHPKIRPVRCRSMVTSKAYGKHPSGIPQIAPFERPLLAAFRESAGPDTDADRLSGRPPAWTGRPRRTTVHRLPSL